MSKNVLVALVAAAGMTSAAVAQSDSATVAGLGTVTLDLVLDTDNRSPYFGTPGALAPNAGATSVGITVMARFVPAAGRTAPHYGIGGLGFLNSSNFNRFVASDPVGTGGGAGSAVGLQRGRTTDVATRFGMFNNFRNAPWNNGTANTANTNAAGAGLAGAGIGLSSNGFLEAGPNGDGQLTAVAGNINISRTIGPVEDPNTGATNPPPPSPLPASTEATGWVALYRLVFNPDQANGPVRDVTVSAQQMRVTVASAGSLLTTSDYIWNYALSNFDNLNDSVSFQVGIPTPGAAALLGLGGLVAARRRRA